MAIIRLKKGRDKSVLRKHPWIFSGAIDSTKNIEQNGQTVEVISADGKPLGYGSYSAHSQIAIRMLSFDPDEKINPGYIEKKIIEAFQLRDRIIDSESTNAYRIVNAESDSLPGLIVDKYDKYLVCQFLSAGAEFWKKDILNALQSVFNPEGIYERSDVGVREKEGLQQNKGILAGKEPADLIEIIESGKRFFVDIKEGHKTGFYLDQRDNRNLLSQFAKGKEVLNCFSYTGGFSVYALFGGAEKVINIDSSSEILGLAEKNLTLNGFDPSQYENIREDVFKYLRKLRDSDKQFDIIVLDPPKFAESASQIKSASRGYKDINLLALKLLKENGLLFTFSCSGHITQELFNKIVTEAASDSGREVFISKYLTQSEDHTISSSFSESLYLKGILCRVR